MYTLLLEKHPESRFTLPTVSHGSSGGSRPQHPATSTWCGVTLQGSPCEITLPLSWSSTFPVFNAQPLSLTAALLGRQKQTWILILCHFLAPRGPWESCCSPPEHWAFICKTEIIALVSQVAARIRHHPPCRSPQPNLPNPLLRYSYTTAVTGAINKFHGH